MNNNPKNPKPSQDTDSKPEAWRSTTMLSPSEIESLRRKSKESGAVIRAELIRLEKEKTKKKANVDGGSK